MSPLATVLRRGGVPLRRLVRRSSPWTDVYGVGRSLIAGSTALTLIFSHPTTFFRPVASLPDAPLCVGAARASLFCIVPPELLTAWYWLAVLLLLIVASGWRPRWTGVVHWWVSYSIVAAVPLVDGGDQIATILALLLLPVTLTDPRRWHWEAIERHEPSPRYRSRLIAWSALALIKVQVSFVYFHAAVGKLQVEEWSDGTALYYWLSDPLFGLSPWAEPLVVPVLHSALLLPLVTWGSILLEALLFAAIVATPGIQRALLWAGVVFHLLIAILIGIPSFSIAMVGALILYLRPASRTFGARPRATRRSRRADSGWIGPVRGNGTGRVPAATPRAPAIR